MSMRVCALGHTQYTVHSVLVHDISDCLGVGLGCHLQAPMGIV